MTALCGGGTSVVNAGVQPTVVYASGAAALLSLVPALAPLAAISTVLGAVSYATSALCSTDPPAMPTFTASEIAAMLLVQFTPDYFSGVTKLRDAVTNLAWYQLCHCQIGAQPTFPTPPTPPALPTVVANPTLGGGNICYEAAGDASIFNTTNVTFDVAGVTDTLQHPGVPAPGISSMQIVGTNSITTAPGAVAQMCVHQLKGVNPPYVNWQSVNIPVGESRTLFATFDPLHFNTIVDAAYVSGTGISNLHVAITATCGGGPLGPQQAGCCPPDPSLIAILQKIDATLTLVQRQQVPFAYVPGVLHSNLSGSGEIAVQGLLGAVVTIPTLPSGGYGIQSGHPSELFGTGYLSWGTADGWIDTVRIDATPMLSTPELAGMFTRIGYSLPAGEVISIQEMLREP